MNAIMFMAYLGGTTFTKLGCDSLLIVSPDTPRWRIDALEPYAAVILGYDGRNVRIFKMYPGIKRLPIRALRRFVGIASRARFVGFPISFGGPAKRSIRRLPRRGLDGRIAAQSRNALPPEKRVESLSGNRQAAKLGSRQRKTSRAHTSNQKVAPSFPIKSEKVNQAANSPKVT